MPRIHLWTTILCGSFLAGAGCDSSESEDGPNPSNTGGAGAGNTSGGGGSTSTGGNGGTGAASGGTGGAGGNATGGTAGMGGAGGTPEPTPVELARCGLDYEWLPAASVGQVVSEETPHSTLTVGEAILTVAILDNEGLPLDRLPAYETLAHRMVYTTQDRGQPREATSLVIVPQVAQSESFPVLVFHHGTTGLNDSCAPSFGFEDSNSEAYDIALLLSVFSSFGYIVVAPDYLGQKSVGAPSPSAHPYLIGEPTAVAVWDATRAAQQLLAADASSAEPGPVALWGASQGGHAAMYSALYQPFYAPEMDLRTGVYAIPPSNLQEHITFGTRQLQSSSGNAVLLYTAFDAWYQPAVSPGLAEIFIPPFDTQVPVDLAASCSPDTFDSVTNVDEVFTAPLIAAAQTPILTGYEPWGCFLRENSVTETALPTPAIPGLFIVAENDTLVWPDIERAAFDELCVQGHQLNYLECAGASHGEGFSWAIDDALDFIDDRLAGSPQVNVCVRPPAQTCSNMP